MPTNQQPVNVVIVDGKPSKEHPLYFSWKNMRSRCNSKSHPRYDDWGGRGIKVCQRWDSFKFFVEDMGPRPEGYTLERIDNHGDYTPTNCKWASKVEQNLNQRVRKDSISGIKGIKKTPVGHYAVRVSNGNKTQKSLGTYATAEDAIEAYQLGIKTDKRTRRFKTDRLSGVSKKNGAWAATINHRGKSYYLGRRQSFFEAVCLRKSAENKFGGDSNA